MTYVIGWHDGSSAYLVADSAITHSGEPREPMSSMGEAPFVDDPGETCEESSLKIVPLGVRCLGSYCGDVESALWFLDALKPYVDDPSLPDRIASVERRQGPFLAKKDSEHFEVLIARVASSSRTELMRYSSRSPKLLRMAPPGSGHDIGSLPDKHRSSIRSMCARTLQEQDARDYGLAIALGMAHQMAATEYFLQHGVGGAFVGASVGLDGARWQPDCRFFFYDPAALGTMRFTSEPPMQMQRTTGMHFIRTAVIRDAAVVQSSFWHPRARVLVNRGGVDKDEWIARWESEAWERLDNTEAPMWIFVSTSTRRVTVLDRMATGTRWARRVEDRGYAFSKDLVASLKTAVPAGNAVVRVIGPSRSR